MKKIFSESPNTVIMNHQFLLIVPMYHCEKQISRVIEKLAPHKSFFREIIFIDNQSKDKTVSVCQQGIQKYGLPAKILLNSQNYNLGGTHKVGFNYALNNHFDYAIILHGDDQGHIEDLVIHLKNQEYFSHDCFLGARFMSNSKLIHYSKFKTFGNYVFNWLFSLISKRHIFDLGSGLNMYNCSFLNSRFYLRFPDDLTFNYYMILYTVAMNARFCFFPISWREDDQLSNVRLFRQTKKMLRIFLSFLLNKKTWLTRQHTSFKNYTSREILPT